MSAEVLIVDDDTDIRALLRFILAEEGYTVYEAPDGISGLTWLHTHPTPLVVVLDWVMPGMDGVHVLRQVACETSVARRHRFILLTALYDAPELNATSLSTDLEVFVMGKPFDTQEFLGAVERAATKVTEQADEEAT